MSQAVKRACDACHRRKVKCDGINPCRNCSSAQLSCTYNAIPQKKGPKGSRAKVISELRETQRLTSLSAKVQNRINGIACPPPSNLLAPTPGMVTSDLVKDCASFFFDNMYAQAPILDRRQVDQQLLYMEQNRDAYCLVTSMCALVMLQPGMSMPPGDPYNLDMVPGANIISSQLLLEEALRVRKGYEYLDSVTHNALATNYFLFACYYAQELHDKAWYYLREATTMIAMIGMDKEEHYLQLDPVEAARRRRLYWLLYSVERAYALTRGRPLTLKPTINLPTLADDPSDPLAHQLHGFIMLVNLHHPFDDSFITVWNKTRGQLAAPYISGLQKQQNDLAQNYACREPNFADLRANQQWLKNTVWQLTNGRNGSTDDNSFYNGDMARELLLNLASSFPNQGMDIVNTGLIEKLIEITFSLTEHLAMQPASRDPFAIGPRECLNQILTSVALARSGEHRFLPLLLSKVTDVLPRTVNPMLANAPENVAMASVDIFDGFGNAGMAQPPMQMMDGDYVESKYALEMSSSRTPESNSHASHATPGSGSGGSDLSSSFVASPDMMSPGGMDYTHGNNLALNTFGVNSMQDMVSPVGPSAQHMHMRQGMPMNGMVIPRQGSFMQGGEYHGMPPGELDFNSLR
ncbi:C6 zinc finger domain containing protein [Cordyceps fumosorosea ARSEF 2679]|uniref:C6 zinc finger domain containing protein n=1 Tax=Cordyceps fumosorosea (strain ARSEF 2679) TaxID=1081104 RepID=A0A162M9K2_CORFA|nr:C6 zinc finger domain containing protein [Cordyceps fumosorosea ARSEF 2679]OAA52950.1 C6 zinc finger domain containing protein [Cordyceps fumosorosea ARSEF 2679]